MLLLLGYPFLSVGMGTAMGFMGKRVHLRHVEHLLERPSRSPHSSLAFSRYKCQSRMRVSPLDTCVADRLLCYCIEEDSRAPSEPIEQLGENPQAGVEVDQSDHLSDPPTVEASGA